MAETKPPKPWEEGYVHPLLERHLPMPFGIRTWSDWKAKWQAASSPWEQISLLYHGFDVPIHSHHQDHGVPARERCERVRFYLQVAEGFDRQSHTELQMAGDGSDWASWAGDRLNQVGEDDIRKLVARKAFTMLGDRFFKDTADRNTRDYEPSWADELLELSDNFETLRHVLWFFRQDKSYPHCFANFLPWEKGYSYEVATEFVQQMVSYLWAWKPGYHWDLKQQAANEEHKNTLYRFRPQFLELLETIGSINLLLKDKEKFPTDSRVLLKLRAMAMHRTCRLPALDDPRKEVQRKPRSLAEAQFAAERWRRAIWPVDVLVILLATKQSQRELDRRRKDMDEFDRLSKKVKGKAA